MGLPVGEVMTALISLYRGDTTLQGLLVGSSSPTWGVFDANAIPSPKPFPYLAVNIITGQVGTAKVMGRDGSDLYIQTSVFTRYGGGFFQGRGIANRLYQLTNDQTLTLLNGYSNIKTTIDQYKELEEPDDITQQVMMRWLIMTQG